MRALAMRMRLKTSSSSPPPTPTSTSTKVVDMHPDCSPMSSVSDNLCQRDLKEHYTVVRQLGSGTYGRVVLARCRHTNTEVALKVLPKSSTKLTDFLREFNVSYYLSPHAAILNTYDVAFQTRTSYVFAQECAPSGDLFEAISPQIGVPEEQARVLAAQLASALDFLHSKQLVHRDVKPENVMLFGSGLRRAKLADFGMTKRAGTLVRKVSAGIPYTPPEVCDALRGERYTVSTAADVWALAVLLFCALTGNFPWALAQQRDVFYAEYGTWQRRKTLRVPPQWKRFTPRMLRLFRRMLDPKPERRCRVKEVLKYVDDVWTTTQVTQPPSAKDDTPSENVVDDKKKSVRNSVHVAPANTGTLDTLMRKHGIATHVTNSVQEKRISDWLLST